MLRQARDSQPHKDVESPIPDSYEAYGCKVNAIDVDELFRRYEHAGFLYPAKLQFLEPHWAEVRENWRRALQAGESIIRVRTYVDGFSGHWSSMTSWRRLVRGWQSQHLVSTGGAMGSRAVLLAGAGIHLHEGFDNAHEMWFRPDNRFPAKVFGTMVRSIGPVASVVHKYCYLAVPVHISRSSSRELRVTRCQQGPNELLYDLAVRARGQVYAQSEEISEMDLELAALDDLYRRAGLSRTRRIWLAPRPRQRRAAGAVLANRGPLGLNFSFLENRCDLLLDPDLTESEITAVATSLLYAASQAYVDFGPGFMPVIVDERIVPMLVEACGAKVLRQYSQGIVLASAFVNWYRHVERFYDRILKRASHVTIRSDLREGMGSQ